MSKLITSIALIVFALTLGQWIRYIDTKGIFPGKPDISRIIAIMQKSALFALNPLIYIGVFWGLEIVDFKLLGLPLLNTLSMLLGGGLALAASRLLHHSRDKAGSMLVSGAFSNTGSFGGLICYIFYGEASYFIVSMYRLIEDFLVFSVGYPAARCFGKLYKPEDRRWNILKLLFDPYIFFSYVSIIIGGCLNLSAIKRPEAYSDINSVLIPLASTLLLISIGYRIRFTAVGRYMKECLSVTCIKFILIPAAIMGTAYVAGLGGVYNGEVMKVLLILASMPPAIVSLIPPQIYRLDVDLANSSWLFNTAVMLFILPILYLLQRIID